MLKERGGADRLKLQIDVLQEKALSFRYMGAPIMEIFSLGAWADFIGSRLSNTFIVI